MRGLVDVRGRLEKVKKTREGRGRLVGVVLADKEAEATTAPAPAAEAKKEGQEGKQTEKDAEAKGTLAELDHRLGELEELIGSSSVALDEVCILLFCFFDEHLSYM